MCSSSAICRDETCERLRDQQPLRFERPARDAGEQLLVHDPLVQRVLVDDDQPVVALGDEVAVVELDGAGGPVRSRVRVAQAVLVRSSSPGEG